MQKVNILERAIALIEEVSEDEVVTLRDIEHARNITLMKINDDGDFIALSGWDIPAAKCTVTINTKLANQKIKQLTEKYGRHI